MRTTVTLDDDLAARLKQNARERGVSFKVALNQALRRGLAARGRGATRYRTPSRDLGLRPGVDLDKALRLAAELEDRELARELELRR